MIHIPIESYASELPSHVTLEPKQGSAQAPNNPQSVTTHWMRVKHVQSTIMSYAIQEHQASRVQLADKDS